MSLIVGTILGFYIFCCILDSLSNIQNIGGF